MRPLELFLDSCDRMVPLLRMDVLADRWLQPSALPEWSCGGLAGHLARSAFNLEHAPAPSGRGYRVTDAVGYYTAAEPAPARSPIGTRIRELGELEANGGPGVLADRFEASVATIRARLPVLAPGTVVELFGRPLPIDDCATACLLELTVHTDDLAASLSVAVPAFSAKAADLVVVTLARISLHRHGPTALVRTLARAERSPTAGISAF